MKKILLALPIFFISSLAYAAGGPIPGVNVSLEQITGSTIPTESECLRTGGKIIHKRGKTFCASKRMSGSGVTDNNGDFTLKTGGGNTDNNGDFTLKSGSIKNHKNAMKKMSGTNNTDQNGDFTLKHGGHAGKAWGGIKKGAGF